MTPESQSCSASSSQRVVLHVSAVTYTLTKLLLNQLEALEAAGYTVRVASSPDANGFPEPLARFAPIPVQLPRTLSPLKVVRGLWQLRSVVWEVRPDLLHIHTPAVAIPVRLVPRWLFPPGMAIAYTVHGYAHTWSRSSRDVVLEWLEKRLTPRADLTLFQSTEDLEMARRRGFKGNLAYLGNGVDDEWFGIEPVRREGPLRMIYMGRLVREKGLLELLDAMARVPGVELDIAGEQLPTDRDGALDEIRIRMDTAELADRVRLLGMLDRQPLLEAVRAAHVIVLPSHREGVPQALMQGLAAGRPGIATRIRGCTELIVDDAMGRLVKVRDVAAITSAIEDLAHLDSRQLHESGQLAQKHMRETRTIAQVIDRLLAAYAGLLGGKSPAPRGPLE